MYQRPISIQLSLPHHVVPSNIIIIIVIIVIDIIMSIVVGIMLDICEIYFLWPCLHIGPLNGQHFSLV